jgi:hypothetical protein
VDFAGDGVRLSLSVQGYQFPDAIDYWDGNWLIVNGVVTHPTGTWRFNEPCLTSFELRQLAEWLDGIEQGNPDKDLGYFTEPCLEFNYASTPQSVIEVLLAYECAPPWLTRHDDRMAGIRLHFPTSSNNPQVLAAGVRNLLQRFPIRYAA